MSPENNPEHIGQEPTAQEYLEVICNLLKDVLDTDSYESVVAEFEAAHTAQELEEAVGYLYTVAIENGLGEELEVAFTAAGLLETSE